MGYAGVTQCRCSSVGYTKRWISSKLLMVRPSDWITAGVVLQRFSEAGDGSWVCVFFLLCGDCDWIMTLQACSVKGDRSEGLRRREGLCDSVREASGQFCKYARGGSNKIRDRPAPGIGTIYITCNHPVTSPG